MLNAIKREFRIAFSKRGQPVWFRVIKWTVLIGVATASFHTSFFWYWMIGLPFLGILVHFVYRRKTNCWRRAWGGWDDLEASR